MLKTKLKTSCPWAFTCISFTELYKMKPKKLHEHAWMRYIFKNSILSLVQPVHTKGTLLCVCMCYKLHCAACTNLLIFWSLKRLLRLLHKCEHRTLQRIIYNVTLLLVFINYYNCDNIGIPLRSSRWLMMYLPSLLFS